MARVLYAILILLTVPEDVFVKDISMTMLTQMEAVLDQLCPHTNICKDSDNFNTDGEACCQGCSCLPDCNKYGRCCFPNDTHSESQIKTVQCVLPASKFSHFDRLTLPRYHMVTSVSKRHQSDVSFHSNCGVRKVAPWGSMHPVYSRTANKIFINSACAEEYNVTDGELWNAYIVCIENRQRDGASYVSGLSSDTFPSYCGVYFSYPGKSRLDSHICYLSSELINTCTEDEFDIPAEVAELNISKEDINTWCNSGLVAPHRIPTTTFSNVFCTICSKHYAKSKCEPSEPSDGFKYSPAFSFVGLLDPHMFHRLSGGINKVYHKRSRLACITNIEDTRETSSCIECQSTCREVLCPSGQLMNEFGECFFPAKVWHSNQFVLMLNLTSETPFNVSEVFQIGNNGKTSNIDMLKSTWPPQWVRFMICEKVLSVDTERPSFMLNLVRTIDNHFFVKSFFAEIAYLMKNSRWSLTYENKTIPLKVKHFKFKRMMGYKNDDNIYDLIYNTWITTPRYRVLYERRRNGINRQAFSLSKLYFCHQIELLPVEFDIDNERRILINKITNTTLYDGQFTFTETSIGTLPRVCIEDSGFATSSSNRMETIEVVNVVWSLIVFISKIRQFH